jgi:hypothetical protein
MPDYWQPGMYSTEIQKLNQERPLNQQAKQALLSVRESPGPGHLYVLQLLDWALEKGKVIKPSDPSPLLQHRWEFLKATVADMGTWSPKNVMGVFEESAEGDEGVVAQPGPVNPVGLAEELLDQLDSRIIAAGQYPDQI